MKDESAGWNEALPADHSLLVTPINSPAPRPFTKAEREEILNAAGVGFTHVVLLGTRDWGTIADSLRFDCRVHILRLQGDYHSISWPDVKGALEAIVALDSEWIAKVAPRDLRHQLLLPPTFFATEKRTENFWNKCDVYSQKDLQPATEILSVVERIHRKRNEGERIWTDAREYEYSVDSAKHSMSVQEREGGTLYRFCFPLPKGFHFDVCSSDGRKFGVKIGSERKSVTHVNVTPWGHVRG